MRLSRWSSKRAPPFVLVYCIACAIVTQGGKLLEEVTHMLKLVTLVVCCKSVASYELLDLVLQVSNVVMNGSNVIGCSFLLLG